MKYYNYKRIASGQGGAGERETGSDGRRQSSSSSGKQQQHNSRTAQRQIRPNPNLELNCCCSQLSMPCGLLATCSCAIEQRERERARCKCVCAAAGIRDNLDAFAVISLETGLMCGRSMFDCSSTGSLPEYGKCECEREGDRERGMVGRLARLVGSSGLCLCRPAKTQMPLLIAT